MKDEGQKTLRSIYVEDYHMLPAEAMTAAVLKSYLCSLIQGGEEERVKTELKTIVKPKLIGVDFSIYDDDERHLVHPQLLETYFDTPALESLLDRAFAAAVDATTTDSSPLCASISDGLRTVTGATAVFNIGYGFTRYLADCYTAVCY